MGVRGHFVRFWVFLFHILLVSFLGVICGRSLGFLDVLCDFFFFLKGCSLGTSKERGSNLDI